MSDTHDIANIWTVLESSPLDKSLVAVAPVGSRVRAGEILAGVDGSGNHHLLIPLLAGEAAATNKSGKAVHLVRVSHDGTHYLSAVCLVRKLDDTFAQFARELVNTLRSSNSPARETRDALGRWKDLLSDENSAGNLSVEAQLGLMAELIFLKRVLSMAATKDTECWKGPDRSQHDFRWVGAAIEVKATRSREGRRVPISSLEQLNSPPGCSLHLAHFRLEDHPSGASLPELVSEVEDICADSVLFRSKLRNWGYETAFVESYGRLRCRVVEFRMFDVEGASFPRIVPASFLEGRAPAGTEAISYTIDISNEPPFPLTAREVEELLQQIVTKVEA